MKVKSLRKNGWQSVTPQIKTEPVIEPTDSIKIKPSLKILIAEYLSTNSLTQFFTDFKQHYSDHRWQAILEMHFIALDQRDLWRQTVSQLCVHCLQLNDASLLTLTEYKKVIKKYCETILDNQLDYPKIFEYTAVLLGEPLKADYLSLKDIYLYSSTVINALHGGKMLVAILEHLLNNYGSQTVLEIWAASGLRIEQFLGDDGSNDQQMTDFFAKYVSLRHF